MCKKLWHQLALVTLLAGGIAVLWGFLAIWGVSTYESSTRQNLTYENLVVDARGDAWIQVNQFYSNSSEATTLHEPYRTLEGVPIETPLHDFWLTSCSLGNPAGKARIGGANELQNNWARRVSKIAGTGREHWYLVHNGALAETGRAYLVGYNIRTKMPVGYCVPKGFLAELPTEDQWFRLDGRNVGWGQGNCAVNARQNNPLIALATLDGWFEFAVKQRLLRTIDDSHPYLSVSNCQITESMTRGLNEESSDAALKSLDANLGNFSPSWPIVFAARRQDTIVVQQPQQEPPLEFVIPKAFRERSIDFYFISADHALMNTSKGTGHQRESVLLTTNAAGEIQKSQPIAWAGGPKTDNRLAACFGALSVPSLLAMGVLFLGILPTQANYQQSGWDVASYAERVGIVFADAWPALLMLGIISALLTWLVMRWHRQFDRPHLGVWSILVCLLGVPGFIAYWASHKKPATENCEACGEHTPRNRDACARCQRPFAEPSFLGTEVFA